MTTHPHPHPAHDLTGLLADIGTHLTAIFTTIDWASDEISQATVRHPQDGDRLYHAFRLLQPRQVGPGTHTEFVYRSHARELLERIPTGADTRAATAAEICRACAQISLHTPMHTAAAGLYLRMWVLAFPDHPLTRDQADEHIHYERLYHGGIDDLEAEMRGQFADPARHLVHIDCTGRHHGRPTVCRYTGRTPR